MEVVARRALPETPLPTAHDELGPVERAPALSFPSWMGRPDPPSICCCFRAMTPPPPQLRLAVGLSARQPVGWCPHGIGRRHATARPASSNGDRKTVDGASRSCGDADLLRLLEGAPAGPQERLSVRPFSALASKVVNKRIPFDLVRSPSPSIYIEYSNILLYTSQSLLPVTTADWTGAVILYEGESISKQFTFTSRCRSPDV